MASSIHDPQTGPPTNAQRVNLMVSGRPSITDGKGWLYTDKGVLIPDANNQPQYVDVGSHIFDSRRLTIEQQNTMPTWHGGDLLTPPEG